MPLLLQALLLLWPSVDDLETELSKVSNLCSYLSVIPVEKPRISLHFLRWFSDLEHCPFSPLYILFILSFITIWVPKACQTLVSMSLLQSPLNRVSPLARWVFSWSVDCHDFYLIWGGITCLCCWTLQDFLCSKFVKFL